MPRRRPRCLGLLRAGAAAALLISTWSALGQGAASEGTASERARRSGYLDMRASTRAMQDDDSQNPAMLWVAEGESIWQAKVGPSARSCMDCHGAAQRFWREVVPRYPTFDAASGKAVNLGQRINQCRARHQSAATAWLPDQRERLALEAQAGHAARGQSIAPSTDARLQAVVDRGRRLYEQRMGQLNLSCAQCHDQLAGGRLAGSVIPQGHPTGYPIYRLEWQALGSLQRRLRGCLNGVRAEPFAIDGDEVVALEAYLMVRARGMPIETPAVRP